jgi:hypothetical protein
VKIASQPLRSSPPPNPCALRALRGESPRPFRITDLQIPLRSPCCAFSRNSLISSRLQPLAPLFALFSAPLPFVFNHFQPLFPKHPGLGGPTPRRPKVGQPFLPVLRFQVRANSSAHACGSKPEPQRGGEELLKWDSHFCLHAAGGLSSDASQQSSTTNQWRTDDTKTCTPSNPPSEYLHPALRTSNHCSPKWSIIPAPASATRLRGRSV